MLGQTIWRARALFMGRRSNPRKGVRVDRGVVVLFLCGALVCFAVAAAFACLDFGVFVGKMAQILLNLGGILEHSRVY